MHQVLQLEVRLAVPAEHPRDAALLFQILQQRTQQAHAGDREDADDDRTGEPVHAIALDRDEKVALDDVAQHEAENQRRTRPLHLLHGPAEKAEDEQGPEVAPVARALEGADVDDAENATA